MNSACILFLLLAFFVRDWCEVGATFFFCDWLAAVTRFNEGGSAVAKKKKQWKRHRFGDEKVSVEKKKKIYLFKKKKRYA